MSMRNLSLTNSVDIVCNSLKFIRDNELVDFYDIVGLFLLRTEGADIVGIPPETLNSLQELAAALGNDSDFFNSINNQITLKANIADTYTKTFINSLFTAYFTKEQMTVLLNAKLNLNALDPYYNRVYIDAQFSNTYSKLQVDTFVNTKSNIVDVFTKIEVNNLLNNKLNTSAFDDAIILKADTTDIITKVFYTQNYKLRPC